MGRDRVEVANTEQPSSLSLQHPGPLPTPGAPSPPCLHSYKAPSSISRKTKMCVQTGWAVYFGYPRGVSPSCCLRPAGNTVCCHRNHTQSTALASIVSTLAHDSCPSLVTLRPPRPAASPSMQVAELSCSQKTISKTTCPRCP